MLTTSARVPADYFGITRKETSKRVALRELRIAKGFDSSKAFALAIGMKATTSRTWMP
ncbi:MAG: hypothetical protein K0Q53_294 [Massilibacillus sp.]|jgi:Spy/CpxP family protein refolding chaperone|nr:hypothetical protein [Massilibacillus sp.]